jgi:hypothetical protein
MALALNITQVRGVKNIFIPAVWKFHFQFQVQSSIALPQVRTALHSSYHGWLHIRELQVV